MTGYCHKDQPRRVYYSKCDEDNVVKMVLILGYVCWRIIVLVKPQKYAIVALKTLQNVISRFLAIPWYNIGLIKDLNGKILILSYGEIWGVGNK